jgi:hypothetical protein
MIQKSDFSAQEWELLRDTPHLVAIAIAVAGGSGLFGSLKEAIAPARTIVQASQGNNTLLREICNREEMKAAQGSLREQFKATEFDTLRENMRAAAVSNVKSAMELLREKASDEDRKAYQDFVNKIANDVAEAAKEGGFLGFGGERISENEQTLLKDLRTAIG